MILENGCVYLSQGQSTHTLTCGKKRTDYYISYINVWDEQLEISTKLYMKNERVEAIMSELIT